MLMPDNWISSAHAQAQSMLAPHLDAFAHKTFSEIIDEEGNQYVDIVFEGGGMLGISLVGYTWVLEQAGIRFRGIGGASAGAINAALLASLGKPHEKKSDQLLTIMNEKNFFDFVDGSRPMKRLIDYVLNGRKRIWKSAYHFIRLILSLASILRKEGINPGNNFEHWLRTVMMVRGNVHSLLDLEKQLQPSHPVFLRGDSRPENPDILRGTSKYWQNVQNPTFRLGIIAADITTETKVEFPKMAPLYWQNTDAVHPAEMVRASMSIPVFFQPKKVTDLPTDKKQEWEDWAGIDIEVDFDNTYPTEIRFADGGIMSNFPFDLFHRVSGTPNAPTFGVKLEEEKRNNTIDGMLSYLGAAFNAARHVYDYSYQANVPEMRQLVAKIPIAKGIHWLDFKMEDKKKEKLFLAGVQRAIAFLRAFNWPEYRSSRS
jgi:NTE family protein